MPLLGMRLAESVGNLPNATKAARRALALAPGWHVAQIELALLLARQKEADEAMRLAMEALANAPKDVQVMAGAINVAFFSGTSTSSPNWASASEACASNEKACGTPVAAIFTSSRCMPRAAPSASST